MAMPKLEMASGEIGIALHEMFEMSRFPMGERPYEEFFPRNAELRTMEHFAHVGEVFPGAGLPLFHLSLDGCACYTWPLCCPRALAKYLFRNGSKKEKLNQSLWLLGLK
ncbi:uncharacterized protein LOC109839977 [Asparagus officinalis]|uniref:uncharacterized protein LOC109839977 n=1 Tax=Asparagus officinalis TaxID=4686 RepID=UPI00098E6283|nr:uncharacterized protein LOC109839977 [Asparagus officinalis]